MKSCWFWEGSGKVLLARPPPLQPLCAEAVGFLSHRPLCVSVWLLHFGFSQEPLLALGKSRVPTASRHQHQQTAVFLLLLRSEDSDAVTVLKVLPLEEEKKPKSCWANIFIIYATTPRHRILQPQTFYWSAFARPDGKTTPGGRRDQHPSLFPD